MNNVAARYQTTYSTSVQEEAVVTNIMIALRPREFFEQHLQDSTFVKELPLQMPKLSARLASILITKRMMSFLQKAMMPTQCTLS